MAATLSPIVVISNVVHVWIARCGPAHEQHGDPYTIACVVVRLNDTTAHVEALTALGDSARLLLSLRAMLRAEGFTQVKWERIENEKVREVIVQL